MGIFPKVRDESKKYLKLPPRKSGPENCQYEKKHVAWSLTFPAVSSWIKRLEMMLIKTYSIKTTIPEISHEKKTAKFIFPK